MKEFENIIKTLEDINVPEDKINEVKKAYKLASYIHDGYTRKSGEPYIMHPLNVAQILLDMKMYDPDMISAAILHDTIEDAEIEFTKKDIAEIINPTVAELVDGVTKISRMEFSNKTAQNNANFRKIVMGLKKDVRIIQIKLADRLHNMRTLSSLSREKQIENAIETMEVFVPLALSIGAYKMKCELEDLALQYIEPDEYNRILENRDKIEEKTKPYFMCVKENLNNIISDEDIHNDVIYRRQNIGTIYRKEKQGYPIDHMYDLSYLKVLVDDPDKCYRTLGIIHGNYRPINGRFRDYIGVSRTNYYQSLHTTIGLDPIRDNRGFDSIAAIEKPSFGKVKIRTYDMDEVATYGVAAFRNLSKPKSQEEIQREIVNSHPFVKLLNKIDNESADNDAEFVKLAKQEIFTGLVYVYTTEGIILALPEGSTGRDYVSKMYPYQISKIDHLVINGENVPLNYILKNRDRIEIPREFESDENQIIKTKSRFPRRQTA